MSDNKPWGRRLVICCDGTWQSSVSGKENVPSNITKLCRLIARIGEKKDDPSMKYHQIVYYHSGIGTGNVSVTEAKRQGGTGAGLAEAVIEAYNFIVQNYEEGDEIFCFGFSRGAYTARAVAGLVGDIGVLQSANMAFFPELYRAYMENDKGLDFRNTQAWKWFRDGKLSKKGEEMKAAGVNVNAIGMDNLQDLAEAWEIRPHGSLALPNSQKVKVVGVFDTVGSLGIPDMVGLDLSGARTQYGFHNVRLTEHVEHAYHALALDERREAFRPTLWFIPHSVIDSPEQTPELKQVWFPGVHINSGGGSDDCLSDLEGDLENLSTATLCWMLQCISPHLTIDRQAFEQHIAHYKRWRSRLRFACTIHHPTLAEKALSYVPKLPYVPFLNPGPAEFAAPRRDPPHEHPGLDFSWGTGPLIDSFRGMYYLNGARARRPGHEEVFEYDETAKRQVWRPLSNDPKDQTGPSNEYIHPICYQRKLVNGLQQHSPLKYDWNRGNWRGKDGKRRFWWYKDGEKDTHALPEWAILPDSSTMEYNFERRWYEECGESETTLTELAKAADIGKTDFLKALDEKIEFGFDNKAQNLWP